MKRPVVLLAFLVVAPLVAVTLLLTTGVLTAPVPPGLPDPGQVTRLGSPITQALRDVAAITTVGMLALAAFCVPPESKEAGNAVEGVRARLVNVAMLSASVWALANVALVALVFSDASGLALTSAGFIEQAVFFAQSYELGQYLLWGAGLAAAVAVGCALLRRAGGLGLMTALSLVALWPTALTGHAAGTLNHDEAVNLQMAHLVAVAVWAGGLIAIMVVGRRLRDDLTVTAQRFSTLAGWCLVLVAVSGVLGAVLRLQRVDAVWSGYGAMVALKTVLFLAAGALGWWQRRRLIGQLADGRDRAFRRLVVLESVVLVSAAGAGVALSRTGAPAPPGGARPLTPTEDLLGRAMPPELNLGRWFTGWTVDTLWLPIGLAAIGAYLVGVLRLRRRGDRWPVLRTVCWVLGWSLMLWATNGAPGTYGRVLFSMHMVQHMTIATAVPVFLVIGTPVTLALRTLSRRRDGSSGPREWLLRLVHSLPVSILGHPLVASGMFVGSIVVFYYSSAFETSLESHTAHLLMTVHFLVAGYLFAECVIGADPGVERPPYPLRALLIMVTFGFHALFSVSLMASDQVLAEGWFALLQRDWGPGLLSDQETGAGLGWVMGEYPLAVMAVALLVSWVRADQRERRRFDRREDRDGGRQLADYNAYLAGLDRRGPGGRAPAADATGGSAVGAGDSVR